MPPIAAAQHHPHPHPFCHLSKPLALGLLLILVLPTINWSRRSLHSWQPPSSVPHHSTIAWASPHHPFQFEAACIDALARSAPIEPWVLSLASDVLTNLRMNFSMPTETCCKRCNTSLMLLIESKCAMKISGAYALLCNGYKGNILFYRNRENRQCLNPLSSLTCNHFPSFLISLLDRDGKSFGQYNLRREFGDLEVSEFKTRPTPISSLRDLHNYFIT